MKKLILLAVIIFAVLVPAMNARTKDGRAAFKKTMIQMLIADAVYVALVTLIWWRL